MRITFASVKASRIPKVLSLCPDDERLAEYVNRAQEEMLTWGSWWGSIQRTQFCVTNGCLTWPREVANIEAIAVCKHSIPIRNAWYEFIGPIGIQTEHHHQPSLELVDRPNSCTFSDIAATGRKVRLYITSTDDVGKVVLLQGNDDTGVWIRNKYGSEWVDGERLTLADPYVESVSTFYPLTGIQKPVTSERILAYEYDPVADTIRAIGTYQPDETLPDYRRSFIPALHHIHHCGNCAASTITITANAKLQHIPVSKDSDWLIIGNLVALEHACKAIMFGENGDTAQEEIEIAKAKRALNDELYTMTGGVQHVRINRQGTANLNRVMGATYP